VNTVLCRLLRNGRARIGAPLVLVIVMAALLAPALAPHGPAEQIDLLERQLVSPSAAHPFGTDQLSRDLLSRILYGGRISLGVAGLAVLLAITIGAGVGLTAGFAGGVVDAVLMRAVDAGLAVPRIFLLIVILGLWGNVGVGTLIMVLGATSWFGTSRLVRAEVLSLKRREFVVAATAVGVNGPRLLARHFLPNVAAPLIVSATLGVGHLILIEAGLSYLGIGIRPPTPSWGTIIAGGQELLAVAPWIATFPGIAIVVTVVAFSLLGDGLQHALDPRAS
jgi:peptide/nickel transport system permease protein